MAARKTAIGKGTMPPSWREKIRTSMLINRLEQCVEGKADLSAQQVSAALGLLRKTLPDQTENKHDHRMLDPLRRVDKGRPE